MKAIRVPLTYQPTGERMYWTVRREQFLGTPKLAWTYTDHDGYTRFGGATWLELVDRFSSTAENYAMQHRLS